MPSTLVLVHTIPALVDLFADWCSEDLPGVTILHVLDEPMLERIRRRGHGAVEDVERLAQHLALAGAVGADAVLVTCSTVSLDVAAARASVAIPVVTIDDAMADEAIRLGHRVALVATATTTIGPSMALLEAAGARAGRPVHVSARLVEGALAALRAGDPATHDALVASAVRAIGAEADVVVLAQATMARALDAIKASGVPVPVLASPPLALAEVRRLLAQGATGPAPERPEV